MKYPAKKRGNPACVARRGFGDDPDDKALVSKLIGETMQSWSKPKVRNDEELAKRLEDFYQECIERGMVPTFEEVCLSTGFTTAWADAVMAGRSKGFSPQTQGILIRAKEILKTFDAKLVMTGKVNPVIYIFRAKNYYGMRDQTETVVVPDGRNEKEMSNEEIAQWFLDDGKTVETSFADGDGQ